MAFVSSQESMSFEKIKDAHKLIAPFIHKTPVLTSTTLNENVGRSIVFKCENLQKTGSFKPRGALHAVCIIFNWYKSVFE